MTDSGERFDPAALRPFFPIFADGESPLHYLDNAATGQICRAAADALLAFETRTRANVKRGVYRLADAATIAFDEARQRVARFVGAASPNEIVFTSGATMGLNLLAHALEPRVKAGEAILVSELEHHSNLVPWQMLAQRTGARVIAIPTTEEGRLDLDRLEDLAHAKVKIIAVTHASNVTGAITDTHRLAGFAKAIGAILVLDGAQRAPHGPLAVQRLGCDAYAFSAHKMFGATGAGALWVRGDLLAELPPFLGGGEMIRNVEIDRSTYADPPHRFEAGTPPIGPALAMGAAADWLAGLDWAVIGRHELTLTERILDGLGTLPGVEVLGPKGLQQRVGVVAFEVEDVHAHDVCQMLDGFDVCLRGGHHCAQPLMERFGYHATARASVALYNDAADVDVMLEGLEQTIARLRV
jgi:cysteine desulfurase / selenocysteine lyase